MSDDGKTPTSSSEGATAAAADLVKTETRPVRQSIEGALHVVSIIKMMLQLSTYSVFSLSTSYSSLWICLIMML